MKSGANPNDRINIKRMHRMKKTPDVIAKALNLSVDTVTSLLGLDTPKKTTAKPESNRVVIPGLPKTET